MKIGEFELEIPLIQGGMGVGVSLSRLAGAVAACGAVGVISSVNAGYREPDFSVNPVQANLRALKKEIQRAKELASGKGMIGVNIMTAVSHYEETCRCAAEAGADIIFSGAGLPLSLPELVKGTKTLFAPIVSGARAAALLLRHYRKHYQAEPAALILEGSQAGGHLGFSYEELTGNTAKSREELLSEVLTVAGEIPVVVGGGVFDGKDMAHLVQAGAAGVQIATRFIATHECDAAPEMKEAIVRAKAEDVTIIQSPVGMPARAIQSPLLKRLARGERFPAVKCNNCLTGCKKGLEIPYCISRALIAAVSGNWEDGLFFSGSNVQRVDRITSVAELIGTIRREYEEEMA